jgi:hypothetical protein
MPRLEIILEAAGQLSRGLLVALLPESEVYELRRVLRDLDNIMFAPADQQGMIPWRDGFFTQIYAPAHDGPSAEMLRVLSPGGIVWLSAGEYVKPP